MGERQTTLAVDLGGEQILLERVEAQESLGRPFVIVVDIIAPLGELELLPHLGKAAAISVSEDEELQRYFHGLVVEGEFLRESPSGFHYRLTLRPWTYFLSHNRNFAIFQEKSALDIIKQVFNDAGVSDVDYASLSRSYEKRTYCVQYGESDFDFVSRLMEDEGIYYYFRHQDDRHVMVLCDAPSSHPQGKPASLIYDPETASIFNVDSAARTEKAQKFYIHSWQERVASGGEAKVTLRDFDFTKPETSLESYSSEGRVHPNDTREVYRYPGGYTETASGKTLALTILQGLRAERASYSGKSQAGGLSCGTKLDLEAHPAERFNDSYLVIQTFHSITAERYRSGDYGSDEDYNVVVEAIPALTPWRAPQTTPKPIVHGLETAIVTGPEGEEIYTDEYGRVKVRFHWDRSGSDDDKSTCFMRVSQTGGLGNIILPRVGHEVLVDFLGGDPDRPLVVGRVFNQSHKPVYALPDNKTIALWRTKTYGDSGDYGEAKTLDTAAPRANELRFEDKGGSEEVFLHAERDMKTRVRHKETHHVGLDQEIMIGHDRKEEVVNNETIKIGGGQEEEIVKDRKVTINGNDDLIIKGKLVVDVGTTIEIKANTSITLKVGQTTVKLDPTSIKLESTIINAEAKAMATVKSPMTTVKGDGMLTLKGGLTLIN